MFSSLSPFHNVVIIHNQAQVQPQLHRKPQARPCCVRSHFITRKPAKITCMVNTFLSVNLVRVVGAQESWKKVVIDKCMKISKNKFKMVFRTKL